MRKILIALLFFSSCQYSHNIDHVKAKDAIRNYIIQNKYLIKVDTLKIDTAFIFTPKVDSMLVVAAIDNMLSIDSLIYLRYSYDSLSAELKEDKERVKGSMGVYFINIKEFTEKTIKHYDIAKNRDSLNSIRRTNILKDKNKIDSTTNNGFYVHFSAMGADSLNKATPYYSFILLNKDYRILESRAKDIEEQNIIEAY